MIPLSTPLTPDEMTTEATDPQLEPLRDAIREYGHARENAGAERANHYDHRAVTEARSDVEAQLDALASRLAAAEADVARLDWLESEFAKDCWTVARAHTGGGFVLTGYDKKSVAPRLRDAIDDCRIVRAELPPVYPDDD